MAKALAYITQKDYEDNFRSAYPRRLINLCKIDIGKISKSILEIINRHLVKLLSKPMEEFRKYNKMVLLY